MIGAARAVATAIPAPATYTIYSDPTDRGVVCSSATYLTARSGGGTLALDDFETDEQINAGQTLISTTYFFYECFLGFDTSVIPDGATIQSATLAIAKNLTAPPVAVTVEARLHDWGAAVTTADFVAGASLSGKTLLASRSSAMSVDTYTDLTSEAALAANINKTGFTRMIVTTDEQRLGAYNAGKTNISIISGDHASLRPRLTVVAL